MSISKLKPRSQKRIAYHLAREDFFSFAVLAARVLWSADNPLPDYFRTMAYVLQPTLDGHAQRQIVNLPPRHGKTFLISVALPAFLMGRNPTKKIIVVSYGTDLAAEHTHEFRRLIESEEYRKVFPNVSFIRCNETEVKTSAGGSRLGLSIEGAVTGRGADVLIIDDPIKGGEAQSANARKLVLDRVQNSLMSRLNSRATGSIICVMQRVHIDDLTASLVKLGGFSVLALPLVAETLQEFPISATKTYNRQVGDILDASRFPPDSIEQQKLDSGDYNFAAQYQQNPIPAEGSIFRRSDLNFYDRLPEGRESVRLISWDVATTTNPTSSYSVGTVWSIFGDRMYLIDVIRRRLELPELTTAALRLAAQYAPAKTLIEKEGYGENLIQQLQRRGFTPMVARSRPTKIERAVIASGAFREGRIYLPKSAPWLDDYIEELLRFPSGFDDQVDSSCQAINEAGRLSINRPIAAVGPICVDGGPIGFDDRPDYTGNLDSEPAVVWRLATEKKT
ncbi:MAG: phage terminase large subunit [Xanthobacteraceae bacterium]|nr:phage terminase large subunit [Xanthobacteraceae bacterium]